MLSEAEMEARKLLTALEFEFEGLSAEIRLCLKKGGFEKKTRDWCRHQLKKAQPVANSASNEEEGAEELSSHTLANFKHFDMVFQSTSSEFEDTAKRAVHREPKDFALYLT